MKKYSLIPGATALILLFQTGCYPGEGLTTEELDIVATNFDEDYFDNNTPRTYHMPDTVGVFGSTDPEDQVLSRQDMDFILDQVERNFQALGYERIDSLQGDNLPDVIVTVDAAVINFSGVGGTCVPWWGWYPWWPGWGWGAGYCYPTYVYNYNTGTLLINMLETTTTDDEEFPRVWHGGINGLLRSSDAGNQDFIVSTIDQAFAQSPYLAP